VSGYDAETNLNQNYYRDYDSSTGRYNESDPLGFSSGQSSTYTYVSANPTSHIDPTGLITWTGKMWSAASPIAKGASVDIYTLTSECVNGEKTTVRIRAVGFGPGYGFTAAGSWVQFEDQYNYINVMALVGTFVRYSGGIAAGIGYGYNRILLGVAAASGWGIEGGLDVSIGTVFGSSTLLSQSTAKCNCEKK